MNFVKSLANKLGVDKAIAYSSIARVIQAGGGVFTIFFIASFLTSEEQGYYYTFGSILAMQIFFELGLGGIITQYVAYEAAKLRLERHSFDGPDYHISRLSSLFHLFFKWYLFISILFFSILLVAGFYFFHKFGTVNNVDWKSPWIILCFSSSLNLFISPLIAFVEGLGKVKEISFLRLITQINSILLVWLVLSLGGKLYASAFASLIGCVISFIFLWKKDFFHIFISLWKKNINERINYKKEILPYQWRIAVSWLSGYFIFQIFNPVLFAYAGPAIAGQMGMTMTALNGILSLALSWTTTKIPLWSSYISRKEYSNLDISFDKTLKSSSFVSIICIIFFVIFLSLISQLYYPLYVRFLPISLSMVLSLTIIINNIINAWATYLRCHKKEPFLIQAVIVGLLSGLSTILLGKFVGVEGIIYGYTSIVVLISLPLSWYIFSTKRVQYHAE
ncbi:MAG: hypothetical protein E6772_08885 [Dysgonomonas sp.]|nr:hypothetical protein [Dysgonomonas sp.]